jgi:Na+/H+-dicarboxylate symporter
MFRKMPFILLGIILSVNLMGPWIPPFYQSLLYGLSLSIKSGIVFLLPFIVFALLFKSTVDFSNKASKIILLIIAFICCSNYFSTLLSYSVGSLAYRLDLSMNFPNEAASLMPAWNFSFPKWIENDQAMFAGLFSGIILGWIKPAYAQRLSLRLDVFVKAILRLILFVIPLFITGFIIKMNHDQVMKYIVGNFSFIFILIASAVFAYIALLFFIVNHFQFKKTAGSLKNMLPAAIAGFGSMSSAAAMPLTILGTEKNSKNPDLARSIIPITVNIHLIGDCFAIPIFAFAVMKSFNVEEPALINYLIFAAYFVLAKFSVAAVPGGGILVMLPILEKYLGFTPEMLSLMTALYILFDPVITCANILGNGGFALALEAVSKAISNNHPQGSVENITNEELLER